MNEKEKELERMKEFMTLLDNYNKAIALLNKYAKQIGTVGSLTEATNFTLESSKMLRNFREASQKRNQS